MSLTDEASHSLVGVIRMPDQVQSPVRAILKRVIGAMAALLLAVLIVYLDRDGYRDVNEDGVSLLDAFYYATVSLSTTGYGDITPASSSARLINVLVITPLRVLFLIVLVGTTLEVLTERSRQALRIQKWRRVVRDHVVVVGYGTKGRSAVAALLGDGVEPGSIVVVEPAAEEERVRLEDGAKLAAKLKLEVGVGHGLDYRNVVPLAALDVISEFSIGHSIVSRALLVGMERAVREMRELVHAA